MKEPATYRFRLYVAGDGPNSSLAIINLNALCAEHLPQQHEIEVVDVLRDYRRAVEDGVMLTPLLMKVSPGPVCKILGSLSNPDPLLQTLGLLRPVP